MFIKNIIRNKVFTNKILWIYNYESNKKIIYIGQIYKLMKLIFIHLEQIMNTRRKNKYRTNPINTRNDKSVGSAEVQSGNDYTQVQSSNEWSNFKVPRLTKYFLITKRDVVNV
jgi:hypothetical protein